MIEWPDGKSFAFTIFDDTDDSTVENTSAVYRLLSDCRLRTTKSVWAYPSRDSFTGGSLSDADYLAYVKGLAGDGVEIASHGVGSGSFTREEIQAGVELFNEALGFYPRLHANHARNPDALYWGHKRFTFPLNQLYRLVQKQPYFGDEEDSPHFWGDLSKKHLEFIRNRTFQDVNTAKRDRIMPYVERSKSGLANYWFSSSDGHTVEEFNDLTSRESLDRLEGEGGFCIVYTHFASGFVDEAGELDPTFRASMLDLAGRNGWFVPVGELLEFLLTQEGRGQQASYLDLLRLDLAWTFERLKKRLAYGR